MTNDRPPVIDYEGSDYQQVFWDSGEREYEDRVEEIALRRLLPPSGGLLLEAGAGAGRNTQRYQGYQRIVLLDYSLTQLQQAQQRLGKTPRFIYVAADIYRLPFLEGLFDAATLIRTLHHLADAPLALRQLRACLKPGAIFILEYANKHNIKAILRYWLGRQSWSPFNEEPIEFAELNFDFHPRAIRKWLGVCGFEIERQLSVSHFRLGVLKRHVPTDWLVWMDGLAQWTGNLWQLAPSIFVRACAAGDSPPVSNSAGLFRCPECDLVDWNETSDTLTCNACSTCWAIQDGIYDFRHPHLHPTPEFSAG